MNDLLVLPGWLSSSYHGMLWNLAQHHQLQLSAPSSPLPVYVGGKKKKKKVLELKEIQTYISCHFTYRALLLLAAHLHKVLEQHLLSVHVVKSGWPRSTV